MLISPLVKATNTYLMCHLSKCIQNNKRSKHKHSTPPPPCGTKVRVIYDVQSDTQFDFSFISFQARVIFLLDNIQIIFDMVERVRVRKQAHRSFSLSLSLNRAMHCFHIVIITIIMKTMTMTTTVVVMIMMVMMMMKF